jgi:hypothetical protein
MFTLRTDWAITLLIVRLLSPQDSQPFKSPIIGLLTLPEVFGEEPCKPFEPREVPLYAQPRDLRPVARIQVDRPWSFPNDGGCEGFQVRVHPTNRPPELLPEREYDYEMPAAIVAARDDDWFQIHTLSGPLWTRRPDDRGFLSLEALLSAERATYLTDDWDRSMYETPGGAQIQLPPLPSPPSVKVVEHQYQSGELWLFLETTSGCVVEPAVVPVTRGWVRVSGRDGLPTVWFHSRGC